MSISAHRKTLLCVCQCCFVCRVSSNYKVTKEKNISKELKAKRAFPVSVTAEWRSETPEVAGSASKSQNIHSHQESMSSTDSFILKQQQQQPSLPLCYVLILFSTQG